MAKGVALLLIAMLAVSSLMLVESASALSIPKPSVPQFSLRFVNSSYLVPETITYTTNPYTGETKSMLTGGYLVKNNTIELTIKKQLFPSTIDGTLIELHFNVRAKGHFEENWTNLNILPIAENAITLYWLGYLPPQQDSEYTVVPIPANIYPVGGSIDVQVRAILGGTVSTRTEHYPYSESHFVYESSDWSNTQTITISASGSSSSSGSPSPISPPDQTPDTSVPSATPSQNSTTTPTQQNPTQQDEQTSSFNWTETAIFTSIGIVVALLIIVIARQRRKLQTLERKIGNSGELK